MAAFGPKIPKSQKPEKGDFIIHKIHSRPSVPWIQDHLIFVSIDIGKKNLSMRIEQRFFKGKIIPIAYDITPVYAVEPNDDNTVTLSTSQNLYRFLNTYKDYFFRCHYVLVERQLPFNYQAVRISIHVLSYFAMLLADTPLLPQLIEINSKLKGRLLGAPGNLTDTGLKAWAVEEALKILEWREDKWSLDVLKKAKKKDDLADVVVQIEAFCKGKGYPLSPQPTVNPISNTPAPAPKILQTLPPPIVPPQIVYATSSKGSFTQAVPVQSFPSQPICGHSLTPACTATSTSPSTDTSTATSTTLSTTTSTDPCTTLSTAPPAALSTGAIKTSRLNLMDLLK